MAAFTALAIMALAGTATKVVGDIKAGNAAKKAGEAQGAIDDYNAQVADLQASDAVARGATDEARFRTSVRGMIGSQRAATAGNNIDVNRGSAVDVQSDAAFLGELDALTIRTNAAREAWGYQVQAEDARKAGAVARATGQAAATASKFQAGSTILGGATSLLQARYGQNGGD